MLQRASTCPLRIWEVFRQLCDCSNPSCDRSNHLPKLAHFFSTGTWKTVHSGGLFCKLVDKGISSHVQCREKLAIAKSSHPDCVLAAVGRHPNDALRVVI